MSEWLCGISVVIFQKQTPRICQEVPDHPKKNTRAESWLANRYRVPINHANKLDLAEQTHVECHRLCACFIILIYYCFIYTCMCVFVQVNEKQRNVSLHHNVPVWLLQTSCHNKSKWVIVSDINPRMLLKLNNTCVFICIYPFPLPPLSSALSVSCVFFPFHPPSPSPSLFQTLSVSLHPYFSIISCSPFRGYLVAAPSVFRAGVEESVSVTIFNAKAETRVQVQLSVKGQAVAHSHGSVIGENTFWS